MEREAIKEAVKEALQEELKAFYIDRELHYQQHKWLGDVIRYSDQCKSAVIKAFITIVISSALGLMFLGFFLKAR